MKDIEGIKDYLSSGSREFERELSLKELFYEYFDMYSSLRNAFRDSVIVKGNFALNMLFPEYARSTKDIDLDVSNKVNKDALISFFHAYGHLLESRGLCYTHKVEELQEGKSGHLTCYGIANVKVFEVDFNIVTEGDRDTIEFTFNDELVKAYCIELSLADKLSVAYFGNLSRRIKDLYDIYILTSKVEYKIDYGKVVGYLLARYPDLKNKLNILDLTDEPRINALEHAYSKFKIQSIFLEHLEKPAFHVMYKSLLEIKEKIKEHLI